MQIEMQTELETFGRHETYRWVVDQGRQRLMATKVAANLYYWSVRLLLTIQGLASLIQRGIPCPQTFHALRVLRTKRWTGHHKSDQPVARVCRCWHSLNSKKSKARSRVCQGRNRPWLWTYSIRCDNLLEIRHVTASLN